MFAPLAGPKMGLSFTETYFACVSGGIFGATIFYFASGYFIQRSDYQFKAKNEAYLAKGLPPKIKKKFTKTNRFIVKLKRSIGLIGVSFWAPFLLSIPLGSLVAAKFYRHKKITYPLIVIGMFLNGLVTTGLVYLTYG